MTTNFFSRIGEIRLTKTRFFGFLIAVCAIAVLLTSCSDDLDVQQSYPFTVEVMPYADKIAKGQTVELRFEIKPEGNYANTLYTIRKTASIPPRGNKPSSSTAKTAATMIVARLSARL